MDIDTKLKIEMCEKNIKWAQTSKLVFLSQRLQVQLAYLLYLVCERKTNYIQDKQYRPALNLCGFLIRELAKIDDKSLTMELHVTEARIYKDLHDITKAKVRLYLCFLIRQSSLTACKMASLSIYVDPRTQAEIDMLNGIVYVGTFS